MKFNTVFSYESVRGQTHAVIKHYEGVTTEDCGITREELLFDDSCFVWHKENLANSAILNGKKSPQGMTPFTVFVLIVLRKNTKK